MPAGRQAKTGRLSIEARQFVARPKRQLQSRLQLEPSVKTFLGKGHAASTSGARQKPFLVAPEGMKWARLVGITFRQIETLPVHPENIEPTSANMRTNQNVRRSMPAGIWKSCWISRKELRRLGSKTPEGISTDRLQGVTVLQSGDQACITVFRNRKLKAYRRRVGRPQ
jgi:hypothetical protein